jgi:hypothetical protein
LGAIQYGDGAGPRHPVQTFTGCSHGEISKPVAVEIALQRIGGYRDGVRLVRVDFIERLELVELVDRLFGIMFRNASDGSQQENRRD